MAVSMASVFGYIIGSIMVRAKLNVTQCVLAQATAFSKASGISTRLSPTSRTEMERWKFALRKVQVAPTRLTFFTFRA